MTDTETKWERLVPKRVEQVVDALRKLTRTGAKDYEPISPEHAEEMLVIIRTAMRELELAYAPYLKDQDAIAPPVEAVVEAPRPTAAPLVRAPESSTSKLNDPHMIAIFVGKISKELLPVWSVHLCSRITDEFHATFKRNG